MCCRMQVNCWQLGWELISPQSHSWFLTRGKIKKTPKYNFRRKLHEYLNASIQISEGSLGRNLGLMLLPLTVFMQKWSREWERLPLIRGNSSLLLQGPIPFLMRICPTSRLVFAYPQGSSLDSAAWSRHKTNSVRKKAYIFIMSVLLLCSLRQRGGVVYRMDGWMRCAEGRVQDYTLLAAFCYCTHPRYQQTPALNSSMISELPEAFLS